MKFLKISSSLYLIHPCQNKLVFNSKSFHQVIEDKLVAASESGKVIFYNLENWHYNKTLYVCHVPITFLLFTQDSHETTYMYVGSFENNLKVYNFDTCFVAETIPLSDSVQCMECNWGYIFIGCIGGSLLRYTLKVITCFITNSAGNYISVICELNIPKILILVNKYLGVIKH